MNRPVINIQVETKDGCETCGRQPLSWIGRVKGQCPWFWHKPHLLDRCWRPAGVILVWDDHDQLHGNAVGLSKLRVV